MNASNPWVHNRKSFLPRILTVVLFILVLTSWRSVYAQQSYAPDSLFIVLFSNGDALVEYDIRIFDPLADAVTVQLFGNTISDLIVTDLDDRIVSFRAVARPDQIVLTPAGATEIRISYSTTDLVDKDGRIWTFAIDSPVSFSVKMPPDSVPIEFGSTTPTYTQIGNQSLLTFRPGSAAVSYIIGFLGTEEQADIAITIARTTINVARTDNPGIILTEAQNLLARATAAKEAGQFIDAERLAWQANEAADLTARRFNDAVTARSEARAAVAQAETENRDTVGANALLEQSDSEFEAGNYVGAADSARAAIRAIGDVRQNIWPYGIGAIVAGAIFGAFYVIRRWQHPKHKDVSPELDHIGSLEPVHRPRPTPPAANPPSATGSVANTGRIPESQVDREFLTAIVHKIIGERPHLRQEDRDVLVFLAQSEGAVFESEVRSRFQLPKTTVWRLVKRLEREELVEIRKAGGQNLIKLRFEGRQS